MLKIINSIYWTPEQKTWGIIGGGLWVATLALRLSQKGHKVTIYESADKTGSCKSMENGRGSVGQILSCNPNVGPQYKKTFMRSGWKWAQLGYHKTEFFKREITLDVKFIEFFKFPPLNLIDKLRLGLTIFMLQNQKLAAIRKHFCRSLKKRWSGTKVFEKYGFPPSQNWGIIIKILLKLLSDHYTKNVCCPQNRS
jgi:hypothetical protein